jgi:hypothetical protein
MSTTLTKSSSSAERTRRHRNRRRQGTRCIIVDMSALEISALVVRGYLPEEAIELEQERSKRSPSGF